MQKPGLNSDVVRTGGGYAGAGWFCGVWIWDDYAAICAQRFALRIRMALTKTGGMTCNLACRWAARGGGS